MRTINRERERKIVERFALLFVGLILHERVSNWEIYLSGKHTRHRKREEMRAVSSMRRKKWAGDDCKKKKKKERSVTTTFCSFDLEKTTSEAERERKNDHADGSMIWNLSVCIRAYSFHVHQADISILIVGLSFAKGSSIVKAALPNVTTGVGVVRGVKFCCCFWKRFNCSCFFKRQ